MERKTLKFKEFSKNEYFEMLYFCRQYKTKKSIDTRSKDEKSDYIKKLKTDVLIIESSAEKADSFFAKYIIKNVSENKPFEVLNIPCGRRQFYDKRKQFFINLYKIRNNLN